MSKIEIGPYMETFNVTIEYKELDPTTGRSSARTFYANALARDASVALSNVLVELTRPPGPAIIWDLRATVELTGDVLRQELEDTL